MNHILLILNLLPKCFFDNVPVDFDAFSLFPFPFSLTSARSLLSTFIPGFVLGIFYFASLWITVRQLPTTAYPIRLFIGSWLGRMVVTLLGFYLVMDGQWQRVLICLGGFITARIVMTRFWQPKNNNQLFSQK